MPITKRKPPFSIRFTDDERAAIKAKADRKYMSEAAFIKEAALGASVRGTRPRRADAQAIGRLLAELARWRETLDKADSVAEKDRAIDMLFELRTACFDALGIGD